MNRNKIIAALNKLGVEFDSNASNAVLADLFKSTWLQVQIRNEADDGAYDFEMTIHGQIGVDYYGDDGFTAKQFQDELKPLKGKKGLLNIHSGGGNVWDGFAIANMVAAHGQIDTKILGIAASAADVIFQSGAKRIMPQMAMRMGHNASSLFVVSGNAKDLEAAKADLDKTIERLKKHDGTLAANYAARNSTGRTLDEIKSDMEAEEFMDGDESKAKGYCDELTEEMPVTDRLDLGHLKRPPQAVLNFFKESTAKPAAQPQTQNKTIMNRKDMIALLQGWGVTVKDEFTDEQLVNLVKAGKPAPATPPTNVIPAPSADAAEMQRIMNEAKAERASARRERITAEVDKGVSDLRITANERENWINDAVEARDTEKGNPVLNRLKALEPKNGPGLEPLAIEVGEPTAIADVEKAVKNLLAPSRAIMSARVMPRASELEELAARAKQVSHVLNRLKKYDAKGEMIGPVRDAWDRMATGLYPVRNANTMSADLLRQVILSETMVAFRRKFASLGIFSTKFQSVPLEGSDTVKVPYYPLETAASTEFVQANGYVVAAGATTSSKSITVGGKGDGVASSGSGRKYKTLQISAYEYARQPWLNVARLTALAADQLALDVRADILGTHIKAGNFGNTLWSGAAGAFDKTVFSNYLLNAAIKAYWPQASRGCILTPDFYTSLVGDPGLQRVNEAGTDETLRKAILGSLLSFGTVDYDAVLPIANFIRGGDGTLTNGPDTNLAGFISYPSALLIATAPIMPPPGVMRKLLSYELAVDDQTDLALTYQYFGDEKASVDNEIIECTYGSGLGELAALKRFTTAGN